MYARLHRLSVRMWATGLSMLVGERACSRRLLPEVCYIIVVFLHARAARPLFRRQRVRPCYYKY